MTQIEDLIKECKENANNHGWIIHWNKHNIDYENKKILSVGEALCLCHSELSKALESVRDDDITHFSEEIADEFIRLFHMCGDLNINIEQSIIEKMNKNKLRPINHNRKNY